MKKDRFLFGIILAISLLVIVTLAIFIQRTRREVYLGDDHPENVIHNYVLALNLRDYQKAYSYLADGEAKPSFEHFAAPFQNGSLDVFHESIEIGRANQTPDQEIVAVSLAGMSGGLFMGFDRLSDQVELIRQNEAWKINRMPYPFFEFEWLFTTAPVPSIPSMPAP
jgi:hypothetical protein